MTTVDVLLASRGLIDAPEKWTQHVAAREASGEPVHHVSDYAQSFCMFGAMASIETEFAERKAAMLALSVAAGFPADHDGFIGAVEWNNAPERTHAEVLAAYDRAIDTAILQEVADRG